MHRFILVILFVWSQSVATGQTSLSFPAHPAELKYKSDLKVTTLLTNISFRNIGPSIMGGRVVDLAVNEKNPREFYVAYAIGGLWYTNNDGQSFTPVFDSVNVVSIGCLAVDWKSGTIWVGTGEATGSFGARAGSGVFKSIDKGKTWICIGLRESRHIARILIHPKDNKTIWVAVLGSFRSANENRGVYRTIDGGLSWTRSLFVGNFTGAVDLAINPKDPKVLYAALWHRISTLRKSHGSSEHSGIYKSIDGGNHWSLTTGKESGFPFGKVGRTGIAIAPGNPRLVYAIVDNQTEVKDSSIYSLNDFNYLTKEKFAKLDNEKLGKTLSELNSEDYSFKADSSFTVEGLKKMVATGEISPTTLYESLYFDRRDPFQKIIGREIYKSENAGYTWIKVNEKGLGPMGWYFGELYVHPHNDQKLLIPGVHLFQSADGGKTIKLISRKNVHHDVHACWINPNNASHIIVGTDGGINITYDNGEHWSNNNSIPVAQFYSVDVDNALPYNVVGGLQDNGTWRGSSKTMEDYQWLKTGKHPYQELMGGDGADVQVDHRDSRVYIGQSFGKYYYNAGPYIRPGHKLGEKRLRFNWITPILLSPHNADILYYGANKLFRSFEKGQNLLPISGDLTNGGVPGVEIASISSIAESPFQFGLLYVGTDDGNLQMSPNGGYEWKMISNNLKNAFVLPKGTGVSSVIASRHKMELCFVAYNGFRIDNSDAYLFSTNDCGLTWKRLGNGLPKESINIIKEDPMSDQILYVGTDGGLYVSFDRGQSFMKWNAGMPRSVPVTDIAIQERENEIVVATYGRSLYVAKLAFVQELAGKPK